MCRFSKAVDIWKLTPEQISKLQPGQWVYANDPEVKGRFFGQGASTVVAWSKRLPKGKRHFEYLRRYAQIGRETRGRAA